MVAVVSQDISSPTSCTNVLISMNLYDWSFRWSEKTTPPLGRRSLTDSLEPNYETQRQGDDSFSLLVISKVYGGSDRTPNKTKPIPHKRFSDVSLVREFPFYALLHDMKGTLYYFFKPSKGTKLRCSLPK